jgi:uncharacterized membrane protein
MQRFLETIQTWHIHPVVDHFTVAILILAVAVDLIASLFSTRLWLRYGALALMIIGTAAAWGSNVTGGWEADKVWKTVQDAGGPAYATLHRHAQLGDYLPWVFLVLSVWRIGVQLFSFLAGTRWLYLIVATIAAIFIAYQGYLGGKLVYDYGIGTALFSNPQAPSPTPQAEATGPATPIPTVYVPAATETPGATGPTITPSATETPTAVPSAAVTVTPFAAPSPPAPGPSISATPAAAPSNPPAGAAVTH